MPEFASRQEQQKLSKNGLATPLFLCTSGRIPRPSSRHLHWMPPPWPSFPRCSRQKLHRLSGSLDGSPSEPSLSTREPDRPRRRRPHDNHRRWLTLAPPRPPSAAVSSLHTAALSHDARPAAANTQEAACSAAHAGRDCSTSVAVVRPEGAGGDASGRWPFVHAALARPTVGP